MVCEYMYGHLGAGDTLSGSRFGLRLVAPLSYGFISEVAGYG